MIKKLAIFCMIFVLLSFSLESLDQEHSFFWTIKMEISVSGKYKSSNNDLMFSGKYSFSIICKANIERDNGDYICYKGHNKLSNIEWNEMIGKQFSNDKEQDISEKIKPQLKLNYIVRENGYICFNFEIPSVWVPYEAQNFSRRILLPRSAENEIVSPKIKYKKYIISGSNKIELLDSNIYIKNKLQKKFKWKWAKKEPTWENQHTVNLKLYVERFNK